MHRVVSRTYHRGSGSKRLIRTTSEADFLFNIKRDIPEAHFKESVYEQKNG
jgi:hypothetical protein